MVHLFMKVCYSLFILVYSLTYAYSLADDTSSMNVPFLRNKTANSSKKVINLSITAVSCRPFKIRTTQGTEALTLTHLTHLLAYSPTHLLTYSLTCSPTHSTLTYSLTLTHLLLPTLTHLLFLTLAHHYSLVLSL